MILFKSRCYNGGPQHCFEARFDTEETPGRCRATNIHPHLVYLQPQLIPDMLNAAKVTRTTYIHDVCVWCGKTIARPA